MCYGAARSDVLDLGGTYDRMLDIHYRARHPINTCHDSRGLWQSLGLDVEREEGMNLACVLHVDGTLTALDKREPTLEEMQKIVGGYIQMIEIMFLNEPGQMIMHEEGKIKELPVNHKATAIALSYSNIAKDDWIAGDVIILMGGARMT